MEFTDSNNFTGEFRTSTFTLEALVWPVGRDQSLFTMSLSEGANTYSLEVTETGSTMKCGGGSLAEPLVKLERGFVTYYSLSVIRTGASMVKWCAGMFHVLMNNVDTTIPDVCNGEWKEATCTPFTGNILTGKISGAAITV